VLGVPESFNQTIKSKAIRATLAKSALLHLQASYPPDNFLEMSVRHFSGMLVNVCGKSRQSDFTWVGGEMAARSQAIWCAPKGSGFEET
jgi:hypothetical protein